MVTLKDCLKIKFSDYLSVVVWFVLIPMTVIGIINTKTFNFASLIYNLCEGVCGCWDVCAQTGVRLCKRTTYIYHFNHLPSVYNQNNIYKIGQIRTFHPLHQRRNSSETGSTYSEQFKKRKGQMTCRTFHPRKDLHQRHNSPETGLTYSVGLLGQSC